MSNVNNTDVKYLKDSLDGIMPKVRNIVSSGSLYLNKDYTEAQNCHDS